MTGGPSIGFIGLGEAGFHIGKGLKAAGAAAVVAYDINAREPGLGERIQRHSDASGVSLVASSSELAERADLLMSTVTADAAIDAARQTAPFLESRHIYADLNSVSPATKEAVAAAVAPARFVEVTIMAPVAPRGHRSPMLLAGPDAPLFVERMKPLGMDLDVVSDQIGAAASVKLCRSIIVKGLEALMLECAMAACRYGADRRVFESLADSFPGLDWGRLAGYMTSRVAAHGERRAREMEEAVNMLESIGIEPIMARAAASRQAWCAGLGVRERFGGAPPEDYGRIVEMIESISRERRVRNNG